MYLHNTIYILLYELHLDDPEDEHDDEDESVDELVQPQAGMVADQALQLLTPRPARVP